MRAKGKRDIGHSVFRRLLNLARAQGHDFSLMLARYGVERMLYRLSVSRHAESFVLKGACLFLVWTGQNYRATKDADLLGLEPTDAEHIAGVFHELCTTSSSEIDGIEFLPSTVRAVASREGQGRSCIRVTLMGQLYQARIPLRFDVGLDDAVTPAPELVIYPTLLDAPAPRVLAYPRYSVVAGKLEAMVHLGMANSRMKDFYDVWLLSRLFEFDGEVLRKAIRNTFSQRSTQIPAGLPLAFTGEFHSDSQKQIQWSAFIGRASPRDAPASLEVVVDELAGFLLPVVEAASRDGSFTQHWPAGGPWMDGPQVRSE